MRLQSSKMRLLICNILVIDYHRVSAYTIPLLQSPIAMPIVLCPIRYILQESNGYLRGLLATY